MPQNFTKVSKVGEIFDVPEDCSRSQLQEFCVVNRKVLSKENDNVGDSFSRFKQRLESLYIKIDGVGELSTFSSITNKKIPNSRTWPNISTSSNK